jgi:hypothetical protein
VYKIYVSEWEYKYKAISEYERFHMNLQQRDQCGAQGEKRPLMLVDPRRCHPGLAKKETPREVEKIKNINSSQNYN